MKLFKKWKKDEKGSATIEFLALVPLMMLVIMLFWQLMISGYGVIVAQSATNEAAKAYALSGREVDARQAATQILSTTGKNITYVNTEIINPIGTKNFTITVHANLDLIFIPKKLLGYTPTIPITRTVNGRELD